MKKLLMLIFAMILTICTLTVVASADEPVAVTDTYYLVQSLDSEAALALTEQGKTNLVAHESLLGSTEDGATSTFFAQFENGSHVEIILAEDIFVPKTIVPSGTGILINTPITVTIKYNGFCHYIDCSGTQSSDNGIVVRNADALIRLIGTKAIDSENGGISSKFTKPSGDIASGDFKTDGCSLDAFKYSGSYVSAYSGDVYVENVRSYSGCGLVMTNTGNGTYELVNCAIKGENGYSTELMGQAAKTIKIDGGYYLGIECNSVLTGSYVKNATIEGAGVHMDCWSFTGQLWVFENCSINKITTVSGRTDFLLKDCTYDVSESKLTSDNGGYTIVVSMTSATCQKGATAVVYANGTNEYSYEDFLADSGASIKGNTNSALATEEYKIITGVALPHSATNTDCTKDVLCEMCNEAVVYPKQYDEHDTYISAIEYKNGFSNAGAKTVMCKNCTAVNNVESTLALFVAQGYTKNDTNTGFGTGFQINKEALEAYETMNGTKVNFGIIVFNPKYLDETAIFADGKLNASSGALQVAMATEYTNCKLLIEGFGSGNADIELVFAGYAYEDTATNKIQVFQKEYLDTDESPMVNKLTRNEATLYTVRLDAIVTPRVVGNKNKLNEYIKPTV